MVTEYRELTIEYEAKLAPEETKALRALKKEVAARGLEIEYGPKKIDIFLDTVDVSELRNLITGINEDFGLGETKNPLLDILHKIEAIKSYGIKAGKRVFAGYAAERKVKGRKRKEEKRGGYYYAAGAEFDRGVSEVPQEFVNKIICGDSEEVLKGLPDNCVDVVLTSPPYNFGLAYEETPDDLYWREYFEKLFRVLDECVRVLKYGGRVGINLQPLFSDYIPSHHIISNYFIARKMIWKGEILWEKNNYNCKYTAWGSWKSPSSPYLKYSWEFIEIFCKGDLKKKGPPDKIDITGDEFKKWVYAKWSIAPERNMRGYGHPAMFPEELVERFLKLFSFQDDFILDPFNGVGTTTAVAQKFGRRFLGIDISEEYCKKAEER
jgi:DNA modification methylase